MSSTDGAPRIALSPDAEASAFAVMMAELIRSNLHDHPAKQRDFAAMRGRVALVAEDAESTVTMHFRGGELSVHAGLHGIPDLVVRGKSEALIDMSRVPPHATLSFLPDPRSPIVQSLARALIKRELRISGLAANLGLGLRLTRVLSIYGEVPVNIEQKHPFDHAEVKARARALAEYMTNRHGMQVEWSGDDRFRLQGKYKVVGIDASVTLEPDRVQITGKDPGMLWRGPAKAYITRKLEQYLNPDVPVDSLPRG